MKFRTKKGRKKQKKILRKWGNYIRWRTKRWFNRRWLIIITENKKRRKIFLRKKWNATKVFFIPKDDTKKKVQEKKISPWYKKKNSFFVWNDNVILFINITQQVFWEKKYNQLRQRGIHRKTHKKIYFSRQCCYFILLIQNKYFLSFGQKAKDANSGLLAKIVIERQHTM